MGKIRGTHVSPGIYTLPRLDSNIVDNRKYRTNSSNKGGTSGGGVRPKGPWVFSNFFYIVFS